MTDSVDTLRSDRNPGAVETAIQGWLDSNSTVTSVDHTDVIVEGPGKALIVIYYTA